MASKGDKKPVKKKSTSAVTKPKKTKQVTIANSDERMLLDDLPEEIKKEILSNKNLPKGVSKQMLMVRKETHSISSAPPPELLKIFHKLYPPSTEKLLDDYIGNNMHKRSMERKVLNFSFIHKKSDFIYDVIVLVFGTPLTTITANVSQDIKLTLTVAGIFCALLVPNWLRRIYNRLKKASTDDE